MKKISMYVILFCCIPILVFFGIYFIDQYDRKIVYHKVSNNFIENFEENNFEQNYQLLSKRMKSTYSLEAFTTLFDFKNQPNACMNFKKTNINSVDIFKIHIKNCNTEDAYISIAFGGAWGRGWKIRDC